MPWWILENTLIAALLSLMVALVSRVVRLAPVVRHGLWLIVLIKLITPPLVSLSLPVPENWREWVRFDRSVDRAVEPTTDREWLPDPSVPVGGEDLAALSSIDTPPAGNGATAEANGDADRPFNAPASVVPVTILEDRFEAVAAATNAQPAPLAAEESLRTVVSPERLAAGILLCVMAAGTCFVVLVQLLRLVGLWRLVGRSVPAPGDFVAFVNDLAATMSVRPSAVRFSTEVRSPIVCAVGRAVLIWPASGLENLCGAARRGILVHELAHLARRDHWIGWLELAAGCLWWWHPLFWYVRRQIHENAELACDAWATAIVPDGKRDYAMALVDLAERDSLQIAVAPALGVGHGSRQLFERRLVMIFGHRVRYRIGTCGLIGLCLLGLAALPGCSASSSLAGDEPAIAESELPSVSLPSETGLQNEQDPLVPVSPLPSFADNARLAAPVAESTTDLPRGSDAFSSPRETAPANALEAPHDDRLKRLEDRLEALISELRELKTPAATPVPKNSAPVRGRALPAPAAAPRQPATSWTKSAENPDGAKTAESEWPIPFKHSVKAKAGTSRAGDTDAVVLTRATYKLPAGKADEIAAFFKANLNDEIEVRVKDGNLQVTATSGEQAAIAQFVHLLQTRGVVRPQATSSRTSALPDSSSATRPANIEFTNLVADPARRSALDDHDPARIDSAITPAADTGVSTTTRREE